MHGAQSEVFHTPYFNGLLGIAEHYQGLAEAADSPLAADFQHVADEIRRQRDELFNRWQTFEDLCQIVIEAVQPTVERLKEIAAKHPPPQSWYDETIDPFT